MFGNERPGKIPPPPVSGHSDPFKRVTTNQDTPDHDAQTHRSFQMGYRPAEKPHVVVIGGGPAGSTVSTLIAKQGYRVELFERDCFPRFHIGESLIPMTYWVLKRLGMLAKMKGSHFVKKYSVQFFN